MVDASGGDWFWVRRLAEAEAVAAAAMARRPSTAWAEEDEEERPLTVVFASPAEYFTDAAPIGNGSLGGMVWGGVPTDKLQLNHDTLWTGAPGIYSDPNAPAALAAVRELVDAGRFADATEAAKRLFGGQSEVYQPLGDVNLDFGGGSSSASGEAYDSYKRELDLHTATVRVSYRAAGAVQYTREHFCSRPHQVVVTRVAASEPGRVSCELSLSSPLQNTVTVTRANEVVMEGVCPAQRPPPPPPPAAAGLVSNSNSSSNSSHDDVTAAEAGGGIRFAAAVGVQMGGERARAAVLNDENKLMLDGADWIVLLVAASSSFDGPFVSPSDSRLDPTSAAVATLNRARSLTYEQLKAAHLDDYQRLFHRVTLRLSLPPGGGGLGTVKERLERGGIGDDEGGIVITSADRVRSFATDEDPALVELLFQYGRYLLISCSRPGTQVSNLQGIWSQDLAPAWDSSSEHKSTDELLASTALQP